jgi:hypothetical protein
VLGQLAELIVNQRQQLAGGLADAGVDGAEDLRDVSRHRWARS